MMYPLLSRLLLLALISLTASCFSQDDKQQIILKEDNSSSGTEPSNSGFFNDEIQEFSYLINAPATYMNIEDLSLTLLSTDKESSQKAKLKATQIYSAIINKWIPWRASHGLLAQVNQALAQGENIVLEPEDVSYLQQLKGLSTQSGLRFNPTIANVKRLWGFLYYPQGELFIVPPASKKLNNLQKNKANMQDIVFIGDSVLYSKNEHAQLELYSTIRGHVIEQIFHALADIPAIQWAKIQIANTQKIFNPKQDSIYPVKLTTMTGKSTQNNTVYLCHGDVMTRLRKDSKNIVYKDKKYHHIIHPKTARPVSTALQELTLFSRHAVHAEAMGQSAFITPYKRLKDWANSIASKGLNHILSIDEVGSSHVSTALSAHLSIASEADCLKH